MTTNGKNERGFTLVELVMVMLVLAVMAGMGASAWADMQRKEQARDATDTVRAFLAMARSRAATMGVSQSVTLNMDAAGLSASFAGSRSWPNVKMVAFDCAANTAKSATTNTFTFKPDGKVSQSAANGGFGVRISDLSGGQARYVEVSAATGAVAVKKACP